MAQTITRSISIDVAQENRLQPIVAKQYDRASRFLNVQFLDMGTEMTIEQGATIVINAKRSDGQGLSFSGSVNSDGTVRVPITYWMLELDGPVVCDISIITGSSADTMLTSTSFTLEVQAAAVTNADVEENEDYPVLLELIHEVSAFEPELLDIRNGVHGQTFNSAGDAVRASADQLYNMKTGFDGVVYSSPAAMVQGEDAKLQAQIDAITTHTDNRYNPADNTADIYVDPNTGSEVASSSFFGTGYIPVTPGETLYFWGKDTNNTYSNFYKRMIAAFDASKEIVASAGTGTEYTPDTWTVPAGVYYVRFTISYAKVTGWTNLFCGLHPIGVDYVDYGVIPLEKPQVDANTTTLEEITKDTNNVLNFDELISKYIATDGSSVTSNDLVATSQYIPVKPGDRVYGWGYDSASGLYKVLNFRFVCAYNSSKIAVSASGITFLTPPYVVPDGISYVRITLYRNQVYVYDNCYIGLNQMGDGYAPYGKEVKIQKADTFTIHTGESLLEGVMYCYENAIQNLIVESGTYDLIAEYKAKYGNDYFDNYVDYSNNLFDAGIWLQNINVKFNIGAKVVCKYTGSNQNVIDNFSAFATGNNVLIDGLVLDSENLRYGIHADYNSGDEETFFIMRNCDLKNVRTDGNKNIGAGLGKHVFWLFENCIFRSTGEYYVLRIHNSVNADAESKIIVKDCYIDGDGFFVFNAYSTSTKQTIVQVCGNSYKTVPVVGRETSGSTDNITMIAWNNEVRAS